MSTNDTQTFNGQDLTACQVWTFAKNGENGFAIVETAVSLHNGWEMDNDIHAISTPDGSVVVMTTNHGSPCFSTPDDMAKQIAYKIAETRSSLDELYSMARRVRQS